MKPQITFQHCAFELPSPCAKTGGYCERDGYRCSNEIEVADRCQGRLLAPDRKDVEDNACNEEGNRKMHNHGMLHMRCQERGLQVERVWGRRKEAIHNCRRS